MPDNNPHPVQLHGGETDPHDAIPRYQRVKALVRDRVASGSWPAGLQIPTQQELCETLQVSRITVARALQELVQEGVLVSRQGVGTFVNASRRPTELTNVSELYRRTFGGGPEGNGHQHEMIEVRICGGDESPEGSFAQERSLWRITRARIVEGRAASFEEAFIDRDYVPDAIAIADLETTLLYDFLTIRCGVRLLSTQVQIGAGGLTEEQAAVLHADVDEPALLIRRISTDLEGRIVAVSTNVHPTNTYNYYFEFRHQAGLQ